MSKVYKYVFDSKKLIPNTQIFEANTKRLFQKKQITILITIRKLFCLVNLLQLSVTTQKRVI